MPAKIFGYTVLCALCLSLSLTHSHIYTSAGQCHECVPRLILLSSNITIMAITARTNTMHASISNTFAEYQILIDDQMYLTGVVHAAQKSPQRHSKGKTVYPGTLSTT